jgi:hypothetical protein
MAAAVRLRHLVVLASLVLLPTAPCAEAADWLSLRTPHFLVIGDASPKEIARVALRAEQFNEVIANVYPDLTRRPTAPIVVVVFKDGKSFKPYQPRANGEAAGFAAFGLSGVDVSYLMLRSDGRQEDAERSQYMLAG